MAKYKAVETAAKMADKQVAVLRAAMERRERYRDYGNICAANNRVPMPFWTWVQDPEMQHGIGPNDCAYR